MRLDAVLIAVLAAAAIAWLAWQTREPEPPHIERLNVQALMSTGDEEFLRVTGPVPMSFPEDHALHPGYQYEWWYFTGNLDSADGERLGYQFTLFHFASPPGETLDSAWTTNATWMAHLALSDGREQRFFQSERFARSALGLAGADQDRWWLRDWEVTRDGDSWHLSAAREDFALDLHLVPERPLILQGDGGYSRKGPEPGNASRYYSATRLATSGQVRIGDETLPVEGLSWLDREWGSNALGEDQVGWDWFALHLDDGRDVMLARIRDTDGSTSKWSYGQLVFPDGSHRPLAYGEYEARVERWWTDANGAQWPLDWHIEIPSADLDIDTRAAFDHQHWQGSVDYWEGMIDVIDRASGEPLGRGYLELSGYGEG